MKRKFENQSLPLPIPVVNDLTPQRWGDAHHLPDGKTEAALIRRIHAGDRLAFWNSE
jgi:hypothetical protein